MLRYLVVLLVLVLLLGGCTQNTEQPTAPTEGITGMIPPATGIYMPDSSMEQTTDGAIRSFRLSNGVYYDCAVLGDDLLLLHTDGADGLLTLYRGAQLEPVRQIRMVESAVPMADKLQINSQGIGYYDTAAHAVIFLNHDLVVTGQINLPETVQGGAWLTPDWKSIYYCTGQGIIEMDLQTGVSRLLRQQSAAFQEVTGGFADGAVIRCTMELEDGNKQTLLINTETGTEVAGGTMLDNLLAQEEQYYLPYIDRGVEFIRFGSGESHQVLWPAEKTAERRMLFANNAILTVQQEWGSTQLASYDLQTGHRTAAITLEGISKVWGVQGDGKGGVWMFAGNATGGRWLYHWSCEKSLTADETVYTAPHYTADAPDTETLTRLKEELKALGNKFGVDIVLGEEAAGLAPENYAFTAEYLTQLYEHYLPQLEEALSIFPKEIFTKSSTVRLKLALVRSITGDVTLGTLPSRGSMQFWNQNTPVVAVALGENFRQELLRSIYLYMETRLLSKSAALYEWYRINPAEFAYDEDYVDNLYRTDVQYTQGETPYFIDKFSMSFAREDRATIFAYACSAEGEEYFKTAVLQDKLKRICKGIREAYGLKKVTTEFMWEQYKA